VILNLKYDNTIFVNICLPTSEDKREKIQALSLAKECYSMKLDLLTNATVVDDAIKFVEKNSRRRSDDALASNFYKPTVWAKGNKGYVKYQLSCCPCIASNFYKPTVWAKEYSQYSVCT
jgi:hypothetical protein